MRLMITNDQEARKEKGTAARGNQMITPISMPAL
jgi:hypothetical protein